MQENMHEITVMNRVLHFAPGDENCLHRFQGLGVGQRLAFGQEETVGLFAEGENENADGFHGAPFLIESSNGGGEAPFSTNCLAF